MNDNFNNFISNINLIEPRISNKPIVFIDGGNNEIFSSSVKSKQLIKTASITYRNNIKEKVEKTKSIITIKTEMIENNINFTTDKFKIKANDISIRESESIPPISKVGNLIRRLKELEELLNKINTLEENSIITLDGPLEAKNYDKEILNKIETKAIEKNILIIGLVKTNRIFGKNAEDITFEINKETIGKRFYTKISESNLTKYITRLHPKSNYLFRLELFTNQIKSADIKKVIGIISSNSRDPIFKGYPYGLILADKIARATNEEVDYLKIRENSFFSKKSKNDILMASSINSHDILDSI